MPMTRCACTAAALLAVLGSVAVPAAAQERTVPAPADVVGHALGEQFTTHADVVRYLEAVAAAAPDRTRLEAYGATYEGRPLLQLVVGRPDRIARLDEILAANAELADPLTTEARARAIAAANPAIVYFSYGIHGNESSSSEAALYTIWDLLRGAGEVAGVLDSVIVVIDAAVNPDGRERYVQWYRQAMGAAANPNPEAREHQEPWPGGRFNHYLFDLNRDWAWATQQETHARIATWPRWNPQVHVDFHEMGAESSYFFFPAAAPINPLYPPHILEWGERFGAANAAAFDRRGWTYFTAESYDLFYPGYGDSWPALLGTIGMTYEQAGSGRAGLVYEREDGTRLTLEERAQHHRTTGQATLRTAAAGRSALLRDYAAFHRGVGRGEPDILLVPDEDGGRLRALARLLATQGIRLEQATRAFDADARAHAGFEARRRFPAGTVLVRARQARGLLATTLLRPEVVLDATFSYDVSAWSLPYAFGVEAHSTTRAPDGTWAQYDPDGPVPADVASSDGASVAATPAAAYGWVLPPSFESWTAVTRYLRSGGRATVIGDPITIGGRAFAAGAIFLPRLGVDSFDVRIARADLSPAALPVATGRTSDGPDLGTGESYRVRAPRVALLSGPGVSATSLGAHWFFLDRTLGLDYDLIGADRVATTPLRDYDVIVAPEMARTPLGDAGVEALTAYVRAGGTLVAVGSAARNVGAPIAEIELREAEQYPEDQRLERALRGRELRELEEFEEDVPGTILRTSLDPAHPLAFGAGAGAEGGAAQLHVLHSGNAVFEPTDDFETIAHFPAGLDKVSGVISERNLRTLSRASWFAMRDIGAGRVILFADDPLFRHFWYATFQPFANALLLGPRL